MRDGKGDVRKRINQDIPQAGRQPSCHEWEHLEYGVLSQPETFGGWIWGGSCIDCVSSLALLARETPGKTNFDDVNSEYLRQSKN